MSVWKAPLIGGSQKKSLTYEIFSKILRVQYVKALNLLFLGDMMMGQFSHQ